MTPKLGTVYDFFYDVWIRAQATPMTVHGMVESKMKKTVWRNRIRVTQYIYVYTAMYWVYQCIYLAFAKARPPKFCHAFWLLIIVYECTDTSPKHSCHSTLYFWAESEKKIGSDHEYLQPLIILIRTLIYSYILVHTGTYNQAGAALLWRTVSAARLCCALLTASFLSEVSLMVRPPRRGLPNPNCHSHGWPHRHCCPAVRPLEHGWHSHTGILNPCLC